MYRRREGKKVSNQDTSSEIKTILQNNTCWTMYCAKNKKSMYTVSLYLLQFSSFRNGFGPALKVHRHQSQLNKLVSHLCLRRQLIFVLEDKILYVTPYIVSLLESLLDKSFRIINCIIIVIIVSEHSLSSFDNPDEQNKLTWWFFVNFILSR